MYLCVYVHVCAGAGRRQKILDVPELELQSGRSYLMWILGTKLRSSGRASTSHSEL